MNKVGISNNEEENLPSLGQDYFHTENKHGTVGIINKRSHELGEPIFKNIALPSTLKIDLTRYSYPCMHPLFDLCISDHSGLPQAQSISTIQSITILNTSWRNR